MNSGFARSKCDKRIARGRVGQKKVVLLKKELMRVGQNARVSG